MRLRKTVTAIYAAISALNQAVNQKNDLVEVLREELKETRKINSDLMDRFMSRDFQDLQINKPFEMPEITPPDPLTDEDLAGSFVNDEDLK